MGGTVCSIIPILTLALSILAFAIAIAVVHELTCLLSDRTVFVLETHKHLLRVQILKPLSRHGRLISWHKVACALNNDLNEILVLLDPASGLYLAIVVLESVEPSRSVLEVRELVPSNLLHPLLDPERSIK
jgi:hypothetical protein